MHPLLFLSLFAFATAAETVIQDQTDPLNYGVMAQEFKLPPLPYGYDALEPHISKKIMTLHHDKHHNTYVTNLNTALKSLSTAQSSSNLPDTINLQRAIQFNGGGHINHSLFWQNLSPAKNPEAKLLSAPKLGEAIKRNWGDEEGFKKAFNAQLLGIQGSGWGWLVKDTSGKEPVLTIVTTKDQEPVTGNGVVPVLGIDMWEHAYYLDYENNKAKYTEAIWNVINWKTCEQRFLGSHDDAFKALKSHM